MKKFLSLMLTVLLILSALPMAAFAETTGTTLVNAETKTYYVHDDTFQTFSANEYGKKTNQTPANVLTDGKTDKSIGGGNGFNAVWIDLGGLCHIDKVTSVANLGAKGGQGMTWYLTKEDPTIAMKAGSVNSSWKKLGSIDSEATYSPNILETLNFDVDDTELYRYVVCLDPDHYNKGLTGATSFKMRGAVAEIDVYGEPCTNVALNRPGFASGYNVNSWPDLATDGSTATGFQSDGTTLWYYVDLGAAYTIDEIQLTLGNTDAHKKGYSVYLSNERQDVDTDVANKVLVYTADDSGDREVSINVAGLTTLTDNQKAAKYQFVYIEKNAAATDGLTVHELEVYTRDEDQGNYLVEIAAHKPSFAAVQWDKDNQHWKANDRDSSSRYVTAASRLGTGQIQRFVIDLEKAYPIRAISYTVWVNPSHHKGYTIYGTNDPTFYFENNKTQLCTASDTAVSGNKIYEVPESVTGEFRYILIEGHGDIEDIMVYTDSKHAEPNYSSDKGSETHVITHGAKVKSSTGATLSESYFNDYRTTNVAWQVSTNQVNEANFLIDLGSPQAIDYITVNNLSGGTVFLFEMKLVATNDPNFAAANDTVIFFAGEDTNMVGSKSWELAAPKSFSLYEAPDSMDGQKYRYVGMRLTKPTAFTQTIRGDLAEFAVYTKAENLNEVHNAITFSQDATAKTDFTVSTDKYLSVTGRPVTLIAAGYDEQGNLVEVKTSALSLTRGTQATLSGTVSFAESTKLDKIKTVKTMLWDNAGAPRPIVASETFAPYVSLVDSTTKSYFAHRNASAVGGFKTDVYKDPDILTDKDTTKGFGRGDGYSAVWIDLGAEQPVDKVTSTVNGGTNGTCTGLTWYLTKEDPIEAIRAQNLDAWKQLGSIASGTVGTTYDVSFLVDDDETYRYVVCLNPDFYNKGYAEHTGSGYHMTGGVHEIDALTRGLSVD